MQLVGMGWMGQFRGLGVEPVPLAPPDVEPVKDQAVAFEADMSRAPLR